MEHKHTPLTDEQKSLLIDVAEYLDGDTAGLPATKEDAAASLLRFLAAQNTHVISDEKVLADARRYRWLRSFSNENDSVIEDMYEEFLCEEDLDEAIDAATGATHE